MPIAPCVSLRLPFAAFALTGFGENLKSPGGRATALDAKVTKETSKDYG